MSRANELGFIRRISTSRTSHRYVLVFFLIATSSLLLYHYVVVTILIFQAGGGQCPSLGGTSTQCLKIIEENGLPLY